MASRYTSCRCLSSLRGAFLVSIIVFVVLLAIALSMAWLYSKHLDTRGLKAFDRGLASELHHLTTQGDLIAQNELLQRYMRDDDPYKILTVLNAERERRSIGLMGVADNRGIIISRTRSSSSRGENTFLISPQGRAVAAGGRPASIEVSSFDPTQVLMTTGRQIASGTSTIGALFANNLLDNTYARSFKEKYLFDGLQVVFYTKGYGIYGSSFDDETSRIIRSHFNVDSDWIQRERTGDVVKIGTDTYYRVHTIVFPGLEGDRLTGAIVFVPYYGYAFSIRLFVVILTLGVFSGIVYRAYRSTKKEYRNRYYIWSLITLAAVLIVIIYSVNGASFVRYIALKKVPYILYNSTLRLQPEAGVFDLAFERPISILVDTGDESINALRIDASYDPTAVDIEDIDVSHSICDQYLEKEADVAAKEIRISCIVLPPGFSGSQGLVADIIFKPKKVGTARLEFDADTQVLANDGLGTNVLRRATGGGFRIVSDSIVTQNPHASTTDPHMPIIFSPTHANPSRWYNAATMKMFWTSVGADAYLYTLDQATDTVPYAGTKTTGISAVVTAPFDGVFYFHVVPLFGSTYGTVRHYKVMVDTTPPTDVSIRVSEESVSVGDVVRLEFSGRDSMSGLQDMMYVNINNNTFLPVGRQTYVPLVDIGQIPIRLRVYDKAGNFTEREKIINAKGTFFQRILNSR